MSSASAAKERQAAIEIFKLARRETLNHKISFDIEAFQNFGQATSTDPTILMLAWSMYREWKALIY